MEIKYESFFLVHGAVSTGITSKLCALSHFSSQVNLRTENHMKIKSQCFSTAHTSNYKEF